MPHPKVTLFKNHTNVTHVGGKSGGVQLTNRRDTLEGGNAAAFVNILEPTTPATLTWQWNRGNWHT